MSIYLSFQSSINLFHPYFFLLINISSYICLLSTNTALKILSLPPCATHASALSPHYFPLSLQLLWWAGVIQAHVRAVGGRGEGARERGFVGPVRGETADLRPPLPPSLPRTPSTATCCPRRPPLKSSRWWFWAPPEWARLRLLRRGSLPVCRPSWIYVFLKLGGFLRDSILFFRFSSLFYFRFFNMRVFSLWCCVTFEGFILFVCFIYLQLLN